MYPIGFILEVTSLSPKAKEKDLYEFFGHCGAVENIEILRSGEFASTAYVTFGDWYTLETAVLLSGAIIVDQYVTIRYWGTLYAGEPDDPNKSSSKVVNNRCSKAVYMAQYASPPPGEAATKAQQAVKTMVSKGFVLGKDAFIKAKAFDDSYHVSSIAAAKLAVLSKKIGLTDTIQSSMDTVKSVDEKYHVSDITKAAILVGATAGLVIAKIVAAATKVVVNSEYFTKGVVWVSEGFIRGVKAAAEIGRADHYNKEI
ncbi:hypothetical protein ACFE04_010087 [Oxalis oulophora]